MEFITKNFKETQQLAKHVVAKIIKTPHDGALVLALKGDLGAGKTTFIQGLGRVLKIKERILSPTFLIMKRFELVGSESKINNFYHLDCYRIENAKDLAGLGLEKVLENKNNLVAIEWAERIKEVLPKDTLWMEFEHGGEDERRIKLKM
jgi:tRNA threonylcarbamoyladenosine biosynthesis protein TsaE